jgi:hypothetical protein
VNYCTAVPERNIFTREGKKRNILHVKKKKSQRGKTKVWQKIRGQEQYKTN